MLGSLLWLVSKKQPLVFKRPGCDGMNLAFTESDLYLTEVSLSKKVSANLAISRVSGIELIKYTEEEMKNLIKISILATALFGGSSYANDCSLPGNIESGVTYKSLMVGDNTIVNVQIVDVDYETCWMKVFRVGINEEIWMNLRLLSTIIP